MKRNEFIKGLGLAGLGSMLPMSSLFADENKQAKKTTGTCVVVPAETAGPYPWPTSGTGFDASLIKTDLATDSAATAAQLSGVPLTLTLTIVDTNNSCAPIQNVYVSIWHCNKDGHYSKYNTTMNGGDYTAYSFFRGVQITDTNGMVTFNTIIPGWYTPRATHIHVQVFLSSVLVATTQMGFEDAFVNGVYTNNATLYVNGTNSATLAGDQVFGDGSGSVAAETAYELLSISPASTSSASYTGTLTIGIPKPSTGVINIDLETGGQFVMGTNYPNPFSEETTFPFTLVNDADVKLELYDLNGRIITTLLDGHLSVGDHSVNVTKAFLKLPAGNYVYQLCVSNGNGVFKKCKLLTIL